MTSPAHPDYQNVEEVSSQLSEGLRSCRAVLSGYRTLLSGEGEEPGEAAFNDTHEGEEVAA